MKQLTMAGLLLATIASPANSQTATGSTLEAARGTAAEATPETESADDDAIIVVGDNGKSYRLSANRLKSSVRVFNKFRPTLAPQGLLQFQVRSKADSVAIRPQFWLQKNDEIIDIALDGNMRFTLPLDKILENGWQLRSNQPKAFTIRPLILSPGTTLEDRRLGDFRLQCRVLWELLDEIIGPLRILGDAIGPCSSSRVSIYTSLDKAVSRAVHVQDGKADADLPLSENKRGYRVPLSDKSASNESRIKVIYQTD